MKTGAASCHAQRAHSRNAQQKRQSLWSKLVDSVCPESHPVVVSFSDIQVVLLLREETAVYFEARAAVLERILR